jgi:hypothetical protein
MGLESHDKSLLLHMASVLGQLSSSEGFDSVTELLPSSSVALNVIHLLSCLTSATANRSIAGWWWWLQVKSGLAIKLCVSWYNPLAFLVYSYSSRLVCSRLSVLPAGSSRRSASVTPLQLYVYLCLGVPHTPSVWLLLQLIDPLQVVSAGSRFKHARWLGWVSPACVQQWHSFTARWEAECYTSGCQCAGCFLSLHFIYTGWHPHKSCTGVAECRGSCVSRTTAKSSVKSCRGKTMLMFEAELYGSVGCVKGTIGTSSQASVSDDVGLWRQHFPCA